MTPNPLRQRNDDALRFVAEFVQADLGELSPAKLAVVERRVHAFINRGRPAGWDDSPSLDRAALEFLQRRGHELLADVARDRRFTVAGDLVLTFWGIRQGQGIQVLVGGSPLDRFLHQIIRLLEVVGATRLQACPAPDCGRIFVKVTKKRFCSSRCQSRVYMRGYRAQGYVAKEPTHGKPKKARKR
jgi:hypothetical protein